MIHYYTCKALKIKDSQKRTGHTSLKKFAAQLLEVAPVQSTLKYPSFII